MDAGAVTLQRIYEPVQPALDAIADRLRGELAADDPFLGELVGYVLTTRGKLVRPAMAFLSALAAGGEITDDAHLLGGAVELIHVASLIHDDVIDAADLRRGHATVNAQWGNQVAVLLGDYLFAKAFHMLSRIPHAGVRPVMALATVRMAQAEIKQIRYGSRPHSDEALYYAIIRGKTAHLFEAACHSGALIAGADPAAAAAFGRYGLEWGTAFQITDDALDVIGSREVMGKPIGSDVAGGKITLPVIHALQRATAEDRASLEAALAGPAADRAPLARMLERYDAVAHALGIARGHAAAARAALDEVPPPARGSAAEARRSLEALTGFVVARAA